MAKIVFIIPATHGRYGRPSTPHVGISYLAACLLQKGHVSVVLDLRVKQYSPEALKKRIIAECPDFVGVTSVSLDYKKTYSLINTISSWGIPVIYGGPHVSTVREDVFKGCNPFAAVYGEGEEKLCDILDRKPLKTIQGIMFADDAGNVTITPPRENIADLDSLPFPAYELSKIQLYSEKKIPLITSRDCPHLCTYCSVNMVMGRGFRKRSPENVLAEIEHWHGKGYRLFAIGDDTFTSDMDRAARICELIIEKELNIAWELRTGIRIDRINEPLLYLMKEAGCRFLAYGIESMDESVLSNVKKGITSVQIEETIALTEKVGIPFSGFFMIGLPGDTFEKFKKLYDYARSRSFDEVRFYNVEPYPDTEIFSWIRQHGTFLDKPEHYLNSATRFQHEPLFETPEFSREERIRAYEMGESLMLSLLLKKTFGKIVGSFFSPLCHIGLLRQFMLSVGFRFTKAVRILQGLQYRFCYTDRST